MSAIDIDWNTYGSSSPDAERDAEVSDRLAEVRDALTEERNALTERVGLYDNIVGQLKRVDENTSITKDLQARQQNLKAGLAVAEATRRSFIERVLDGIRDEVNRLYEVIHPGENSGLDRLYMDENRRASLVQKGKFEGIPDVVPQAYFSESHLDTLGFCLWLALAKEARNGNAVLVLDDVFTSVDAQHFRRINNLLAQEAPHFQQLIVATHSRHWEQFYKAAGGSAYLVRLAEWTLGAGIRAFEDPGVIAQLESDLEAVPFPRQAVASRAGILLERILDEVAVLYRCSVPRKRDARYTLGELLGTTKKTLRVAQIKRVVLDSGGGIGSWETIDLKPLFDTIDSLQFIRNEVGAHFNLDGLHLSDSDVATFGSATHQLAHALICTRCGRLPSKNLSAHWGCSCAANKTELTPLQKK